MDVEKMLADELAKQINLEILKSLGYKDKRTRVKNILDKIKNIKNV